jgi:uncharacterized protein (DUF1697 family)
MKKYIAFLRGINVGNIRIKMPDLKAAFERRGCREVTTYLQSGNVVFKSDTSIVEIKLILEQELSQTFDYEAFVLLYDFNILANVVAKYPFSQEETHHAYIIFVDNTKVFEELKTLAAGLENEIKWIETGDNQVIYWKVGRGDSLSTPFAKILAKAKYKSNTTTRNINTLEKMISE